MKWLSLKRTIKDRPRISLIISLLILAIGMALFDFSMMGLYQKQYGDTPSYVDIIDYYAGKGAPHDPERLIRMQARLLKPGYGVLGAALSPVLTAEQSLLVLNLIFFAGTIIVLFLLLKELGFDDRAAAIGTTWFCTAYPLLKYGFALLTDMGGYFFAVLSILLFLKAFKRRGTSSFLLAGVLSGIGFVTKETGGMGIVFATSYLLLNYKSLGWKRTAIYLSASILPFVVIYGLAQYQASLFSGYGFATWISSNEQLYHRQLTAFLGTMTSTFNLLWIYVIYGLLRWKSAPDKKALVSLLLAALPVLYWPIYISRILFFLFLFIIPLALHGWRQAIDKLGTQRPTVAWALAVLPCLVSITLFLLSGSGSLFRVLGRS